MSAFPVRRANQMGAHSQLIPSDITDIEARRTGLGVPRKKICDTALVGVSTYRRLLSGECAPQPRTVIRLARALAALSGGPAIAQAPTYLTAFWRAAVLFLAPALGADAGLALAPADGPSRPMDREWLKAAKARQLAFYLTHVELQAGFADIAAACATTKQRVHKAVRTAEQLRDDPAIDALLSRAAAAVTGKEIA